MSKKRGWNVYSKTFQYIGLGLLALTAIIVGVVAFQSDTTPVAQEAADRPPKPTPSETPPIRFAAVGDSITESNSHDFANLEVGSSSWVSFASNSKVKFAGGWADGGSSTSQMLDNVKPVKADVLVILAGTNDALIPFSESASNLEAIVKKVGIDSVIVSAIPPRDNAPEIATAYNSQLKDLAKSEGWIFVDAPAGLRSNGLFKPGMTSDGIHPTKAGQEILGEALGKAITSLG